MVDKNRAFSRSTGRVAIPKRQTVKQPHLIRSKEKIKEGNIVLGTAHAHYSKVAGLFDGNLVLPSPNTRRPGSKFYVAVRDEVYEIRMISANGYNLSKLGTLFLETLGKSLDECLWVRHYAYGYLTQITYT